MNANRFDAMSQIVTRERNRRGIVRALVGLAVGSGLIQVRPEQASARKKRGKKRKPCAPCQQRTNGRCNGAKPNGASCGECGTCLDGVCTPANVDCGGFCTFCDAEARCRIRPNGTPCLGDGKCLHGECNQPL